MDRFAQMVVAAARQAEADSGIDVAGETRAHRRLGRDRDRRARQLPGLRLHAQGPRRRPGQPVQSIPAIIPNMGAAWVSMELGHARAALVRSARPAPRRTWRSARRLDAIRLGRADVMLAGGTEAGITEVGIAGFGAMRALSRRNDEPEKASRPFDARPRRVRDGRGRRDRRPRGARARAGARREDLRGDRRLRPLLGRPARDRARPDRRGTGAGDARWRSTTPASSPTRSTTSTRTAPRRRSATRARRA